MPFEASGKKHISILYDHLSEAAIVFEKLSGLAVNTGIILLHMYITSKQMSRTSQN